MAIEATRLDPDSLTPVATWCVDAAPSGDAILAPMRHFAAHAEGVYRLDFPGAQLPTDLEVRVENMLESSHTLLLASRSTAASRRARSTPSARGPSSTINPQDSLEALRASTGRAWYRDAASDLVWVKLRGGSCQFWDPTGTLAVRRATSCSTRRPFYT